MKRPFLVLLALAATVGFGTWLVRTPHALHEILTACGAWVLGFWLASAIQSPERRRRRRRRREIEEADEEWDEEDGEEEEPDEDWDDDEDEWEEESG